MDTQDHTAKQKEPKQQQRQQMSASTLREAASALKSLHDGSSGPGTPTGATRPSAPPAAASLQAAVEASFASAASQKNSTNTDKVADQQEAAMDGKKATTGDEKSKQFNEEIPLTFPQRLMELLDSEESNDIIGWLPHGRGFLIYQKRRFAADILPKHFKQSKFTSFTRKLNRWGFTRISRGPETGAYYHPYFRKGNLRMCLQMTCQSAAKTPTPSGAAGTAGAAAATNTAPAPPNAVAISMLSRQLQEHAQSMQHQAATAQRAVPKAVANNPIVAKQHQQQQQQLLQLPPSPSAGTLAQVAPSGTNTDAESATASVLRLRQLQRQQEELVLLQRQIQEEIQKISATLPEKIAEERRQAATASSSGASDRLLPVHLLLSQQLPRPLLSPRLHLPLVMLPRPQLLRLLPLPAATYKIQSTIGPSLTRRLKPSRDPTHHRILAFSCLREASPQPPLQHQAHQQEQEQETREARLPHRTSRTISAKQFVHSWSKCNCTRISAGSSPSSSNNNSTCNSSSNSRSSPNPNPRPSSSSSSSSSSSRSSKCKLRTFKPWRALPSRTKA
mmetsp:Transcript_11250/g.24326  ORF Transcript_11250/g.24326 Transcript_11250/m.24326 type:complete len:561 (-) Transcript_11250:317-1999(-)